MKKYCFGVDLGGTTIKIGFFESDGRMLSKWEIPTRKENSGILILGDIADAVLDKITGEGLKKDDILGIGLGVPGPVVQESIVRGCVNLGWEEVNAAESLYALTGIPVKVVNDADAAALGEMFKGCGQGHRSMVMFTLGTGVGGGIIVNGNVIEGTHGSGGEIGHMVIAEPEDVVGHCNCGHVGCLEQVASATGIVHVAQRLLEVNNTPSKLRELPDFGARDIFDAARGGDEIAVMATEKMMRYLGRAASFIGCVVDPEIIVFGGGVSRAGEYLRQGIERYYREYAFTNMKETPIILASLGNDAGMIGAVSLVCNR